MEDGHRRWLALGYLYPALMLGFAAASIYFGYRSQIDFRSCGPNANIVCLDRLPYFAFETGVFTVLAFLSYRAVKRTRKEKKDLWTMRVYWPGVLGAFSALALLAYVVSIVPSRGCNVGLLTPLYFLYGCWDPGVTLWRVALFGGLTAGFMTLFVTLPERLQTLSLTPRARREAPTPPKEGASDETVEEIPAR